MKDGEYADNKIIKLRKLHSRILWHFDLEVDAVPIRNKRVSFSYRNLFDGKTRMLLPAHFVQMPDTLARLRYLSEHKPQLILTGNDVTENICMSCISRNGSNLEEAVLLMQGSILSTAPESVCYETGEIIGKNCDGYWFEYKSFTINDEAYNFQFLLGSEQIVILGVFNCCIRYFEEWKPFIMKALEYTEIFDRRQD
jgi:hypothetical protein